METRRASKRHAHAEGGGRANACRYVCLHAPWNDGRTCVREPGHGWLGSRGLGSIGHSYGNVSNYRTELCLPEPKTLSANQCWYDVEEEREAIRDSVLVVRGARREAGGRLDSAISTVRRSPATGLPMGERGNEATRSAEFPPGAEEIESNDTRVRPVPWTSHSVRSVSWLRAARIDPCPPCHRNTSPVCEQKFGSVCVTTEAGKTARVIGAATASARMAEEYLERRKVGERES